jgi:hypothetical protein
MIKFLFKLYFLFIISISFSSINSKNKNKNKLHTNTNKNKNKKLISESENSIKKTRENKNENKKTFENIKTNNNINLIQNLDTEKNTNTNTININNFNPNSKEDKYTCESLKVTNNGNECMGQSTSENNCCYFSKGDQKSCYSINKNSKEYDNLKYYNGLKSMQFFSTSPTTKDIELRCNKELFNENVIQKAKKCSEVKNPNSQICSNFSDDDIQCCYVNSNDESTGKNYSNCSGNIFPMKLTSYALKNNGVEFSFLCNLNENQSKIIMDCANVIPNSKNDCEEKSYDNLVCRLGSINNTKICVGINGNIEMLKDFNLSDFLKKVEFPQNYLSLILNLDKTNKNSSNLIEKNDIKEKNNDQFRDLNNSVPMNISLNLPYFENQGNFTNKTITKGKRIIKFEILFLILLFVFFLN